MASAGSRTDVAEAAIAQDIFHATTNIASLPNSFYIALTTTAPTDSTAGTQATYTGYARVSLVRDNTNWSITNASGVIKVTNINQIVFGTCTAGGQTINGIEIYTAASGGTRMYWTAFTVGTAIVVGSAPVIPVGGLEITVD